MKREPALLRKIICYFLKLSINEKLENGYYDLTNGGCGIKKGYNTENIVLNAEKLEENNSQNGKCCYYY